MSLNVGVDPPDVVRRSPCAFLECWLDPVTSDPEKSVQQVGEALVKQYELLQARSKYIAAGDPHPETLEQECKRARRAAGMDRVLFHFNGHGVPSCTAAGEIWVFNEDFTQYLPVSMYELMHWLVEPTVYVFDCNGAGHLVEWYQNALHESANSSNQALPPPSQLVGMSVIFASCGKNEQLPSNPNLPADVFTSCLTTPIRMALLWHVQQKSMLTAFSDLEEIVSLIPGQLDSRRTPLGELNWIFTAVTDAIAYHLCEADLFQRLFREDTLLASLCRNFLLSERVMRSSHMNPISFPALPLASQHPLWLTWDLEAERCIAAHALSRTIPNSVHWVPSTFFEDQLKGLDIWTAQGDATKPSPAALPCLLQALLSQSMREKALWSLARYMDLGPWAVGRALMLGVFPYLLKLLRSGSRNLRAPLMLVWGKVIALEPKAVPELATRETIEYFLHTLASGSSDDNQRVMACFVLSQCCAHGEQIRDMVLTGDFLGLITVFSAHSDARLRTWCALGAGYAWRENAVALGSSVSSGCFAAIALLHLDVSARVRAACAFAMGMAGSAGERIQYPFLAQLAHDGSPHVRREVQLGIMQAFQADPVEFRKVAMASLQAELEDTEVVVTSEEKRVMYQLWESSRLATQIEPDLQVRIIAVRTSKTVSSTLSAKLLGLASVRSSGAAPRSVEARGGLLTKSPSSSSLASSNAVGGKSPKAKSPRSFGWSLKKQQASNEIHHHAPPAVAASYGKSSDSSQDTDGDEEKPADTVQASTSVGNGAGTGAFAGLRKASVATVEEKEPFAPKFELNRIHDALLQV